MEGAPSHAGPTPSVDAAEARELLAAGAAVLVDVREPWEWAQGHVAGSLHIPLMDLPERLHDLPRDRTLVVACAHGVRSVHAARALRANGFPDVVNLAGGLEEWPGADLVPDTRPGP